MSVLLRYFKPYALYILLAIVLLFGQASCDLALPDLMSDIVNDGITTGNTSYIISTGFKMLGVALISASCTVTVGFLGARAAAGVCRGLRRDVFISVEGFSNAELDRFSTSSLITRTTNDITQIQMLIVMMIRMVFYAPIMAVGGILHALAKDKSMSWIIALAVALLFMVVFSMFSLVMPKFQVVQKLIDRLNLVVRENLEGLLVVRAFDTQTFEENRFDTVNRDLTKTNLFVNRTMSGMMPAMMLIMNLITLLVVWVGSNQVSSFQMEVGDMMAYMQYVMQIIMAFLMMSMMFIMIPRAIVSINRVVEVLQTKSSITDARQTLCPDKIRGVVEYRHVSFRYPGGDGDVLSDISFTAVPQKGVLFSGTIRSNLAYGDRTAGEEQIERSARTAQAMEFIESKPDLFDTLIAQGGGNVSGGQKQRLSIARALVKNAPINIFDDSFSALDFKTDAKLRKALKEETGGTTQFLVAQRISTIMNADQIIVLDHGKMVGRGTHRELMADCKVYREIALSQLSEEELQ